MDRQSLHDSIEGLISSYHELNPTAADEFDEEPSPLEFMRFVARNRPFVVRNGAADWAARKKWNASYLREVMAGQTVNVAVTANGDADAPHELDDGRLVFVKPYENDEPFDEVLAKVQSGELDPKAEDLAYYAQTRELQQRCESRYSPPSNHDEENDNLRNEYTSLFSDCPRDIPFARIALQKSPDAINFWLGNSHSTTALHKDNYENIYVQIRGQKHFVLLPPVEAACINEQSLPAATYRPLKSELATSKDLEVRLDEPDQVVPFATWDPDRPDVRPTPFSKLSRATRITLNEGDMMYLPALWYHKVSQSCSDEGICVAVNYWYDMEFSGPFWPLCSFARGVGLLSNGSKASRQGDNTMGPGQATEKSP